MSLGVHVGEFVLHALAEYLLGAKDGVCQRSSPPLPGASSGLCDASVKLEHVVDGVSLQVIGRCFREPLSHRLAAECCLLGRSIRHRHILRIIAACPQVDTSHASNIVDSLFGPGLFLSPDGVGHVRGLLSGIRMFEGFEDLIERE